MEMSTVIKSLNELEKLKVLLFDEYQYYIFEHIPKPFIIDENALKDDEDDEEVAEQGKNIIFSDNIFWKKNEDLEKRLKKLSTALNEIKKRNQGEEKSLIDQKLLDMMNQFTDAEEGNSEIY